MNTPSSIPDPLRVALQPPPTRLAKQQLALFLYRARTIANLDVPQVSADTGIPEATVLHAEQTGELTHPHMNKLANTFPEAYGDLPAQWSRTYPCHTTTIQTLTFVTAPDTYAWATPTIAFVRAVTFAQEHPTISTSEQFGHILALTRAAAGYSTARFADIVHITTEQLHNIETGDTLPAWALFDRIITALTDTQIALLAPHIVLWWSTLVVQLSVEHRSWRMVPPAAFPTILTQLGEATRACRLGAGFDTPDALAAKVGVAVDRITALEAGKYAPNQALCTQLNQVLPGWLSVYDDYVTTGVTDAMVAYQDQVIDRVKTSTTPLDPA